MIPELEWWKVPVRLGVAAGLTGAIGLECEPRERAGGSARPDRHRDRARRTLGRFRRAGHELELDLPLGPAEERLVEDLASLERVVAVRWTE